MDLPAPPRPSEPLFSADEAAHISGPVSEISQQRQDPTRGAGQQMPPAAGLTGRRVPTPLDQLVSRVGAERTVPTNVYRARRPAVAVLLIMPAIGVGLLMVRALAIAAFGKTFDVGGVIASSLVLASLPLLVSGLYGLITGAAHGAEQWGFRVWARPPLAYLLVGISFVAAAGLALT